MFLAVFHSNTCFLLLFYRVGEKVKGITDWLSIVWCPQELKVYTHNTVSIYILTRTSPTFICWCWVKGTWETVVSLTVKTRTGLLPHCSPYTVHDQNPGEDLEYMLTICSEHHACSYRQGPYETNNGQSKGCRGQRTTCVNYSPLLSWIPWG